MNINSIVSKLYQSVTQTQNGKKISTDYETAVNKAESEADKRESFQKEIWNEIDSMPWSSSMNVSIQISDKAFERMMNDKDFKDDMMKLIREDCAAGHPPIVSLLESIDENGYTGNSYNEPGIGDTAFSAHSKGKDTFYVKKAKKKDELQKYYEEQYLKQQQQRKLADEEYQDTAYKRKRLQSETVARLYEDKVTTAANS